MRKRHLNGPFSSLHSVTLVLNHILSTGLKHYNTPTASVITNYIISNQFHLKRGTQQGSPLSQLLFALFTETLAAAIRQSHNISGIQSKHHHHKISFYADDILLNITSVSP